MAACGLTRGDEFSEARKINLWNQEISAAPEQRWISGWSLAATGNFCLWTKMKVGKKFSKQIGAQEWLDLE